MAEEILSSEIQTIAEGTGPLYHRVYSVDIPVPLETAQRALDDLKLRLNDFSPQILAKFNKVSGSPDVLLEGDQFFIDILGPWNGPVTVGRVADHEFSLLTLQDHMESGEIHFRILPKDDQRVRFEIESLARSKDSLVDFLYDKIPIAQFFQTEMWSQVCTKFASFAFELQNGGVPNLMQFEVQIETAKKDEESGQWIQV